jgi:hypothetical protein
MLDSSTFIHSCIAGQTRLLIKLRSPLAFPEYVFRVELGSTAHDDTRQAAQQCVSNNQISIKSLSLEELALLASLNAPRRAGIGELACVLIAHRERGVVLCDDEKCKSWIRANLNPVVWECIEEVLLEAAEKYHLSEFDLAEIQKTLASQRYLCRYDLRTEHLRRELSRRSQAGTQDT